MPQVLLFGSEGMLAQAIMAQLNARELDHYACDRDQCDITDASAVKKLAALVQPKLIINAAAYTNVDGCETETQLANQVNGVGVGNLANTAKSIGARLVHYSTDFVFNGAATTPYHTDHQPAPISAYGKSKLLGETAILSAEPDNWLIIRTAWLYGCGGKSFPRTIVERARSGGALKVVSDQVGAPTLTNDLAEATMNLLDANANGIYHFTNAGQCTWHEFATAACEVFRIPTDIPAITSDEWAKIKPNSAPRPRYSVLDLAPYERATGQKPRAWREALEAWKTEVDQRGGF